MTDQLNQAIVKRSYVTTAIFSAAPTKETREALAKYGFQYDGRSGNWFRSEKQAAIISEESVASNIAA